MIRRDPSLEPRYASQVHGAGAREAAGRGLESTEVMAPGADTLGAPAVNPAASSRRPRAGHRAAWVLSLAVMGIIVGVVVVGAMKFLNGPVVAAGGPTLAQAQAKSLPKPTTNQLAGLYFDMTYPALFDQVGQLKNDSQALEQYNISSKKDYRRVMAVSVRPLTSNLLDDDSSYKFRRISPKDYEERSDKLGGEAVAVMSKLDHTEVTLFWAHQGRLLTIAITSSNPNDVVADYMKAVETTLRWRQ